MPVDDLHSQDFKRTEPTKMSQVKSAVLLVVVAIALLSCTLVSTLPAGASVEKRGDPAGNVADPAVDTAIKILLKVASG
ncbi:hypothetical protein ElyMa_006302400 [Elysia marginata]|uniref:Uncharacterized protein n=1 Tax=Elysia marginata TaxID=1093978 RepID=A0AAV4HHQ5_9GAST|nr:hypothetical protein ElyMa_006302400 [Elysia marginata]